MAASFNAMLAAVIRRVEAIGRGNGPPSNFPARAQLSGADRGFLSERVRGGVAKVSIPL
jgi:hypothetical protein